MTSLVLMFLFELQLVYNAARICEVIYDHAASAIYSERSRLVLLIVQAGRDVSKLVIYIIGELPTVPKWGLAWKLKTRIMPTKYN